MPEDTGVTVPDPFSVIVTDVALPPNVFPATVTGWFRKCCRCLSSGKQRGD